jgi:hypothetical protein
MGLLAVHDLNRDRTAAYRDGGLTKPYGLLRERTGEREPRAYCPPI